MGSGGGAWWPTSTARAAHNLADPSLTLYLSLLAPPRPNRAHKTPWACIRRPRASAHTRTGVRRAAARAAPGGQVCREFPAKGVVLMARALECRTELEAEGEVRKLVESMPKRFADVIEAEGGPTDY